MLKSKMLGSKITPMKSQFLLLALAIPFNSHTAEMRCGWVLNPTPNNVWLHDRDATWTIASGGNLEETPSLYKAYEAFEDDNQIVRTNGIYGYSCACMQVDVDQESERITHIYKVSPLSLKRCQDDRSISDYVLD